MPKMTVDAALEQGRQCLYGGRFAEALAIAQAILAQFPDEHPALQIAGVAEYGLGHLEAAVEHLRRATALAPSEGEYHANLSGVYLQQARFVEAEHFARRAIQLSPGLAGAWIDLGNAVDAQGRSAEAADAYQQALRLSPDSAAALANLAVSLFKQGRLADAEAIARRAVQLRADSCRAWHALGNCLQEQGRPEEALAALQHALACTGGSQDSTIHTSLAAALASQGRQTESHAEFWQAVELDPANPAVLSNALASEHYLPEVTLARLAQRHALWQQRFGQPVPPPPPRPARSQRPLRIGLVSRDLGQHPVGFFVVRLLENLDRRQFEVHAYSDRAKEDAITQRIKAATAAWHDARTWSDAALAEQIRSYQVDVLVDLAGHTNMRLPVFARKPAPVQVTWAGYVGTTGLAAMDFLLADRWQVPPEAEPFLTEKVLRMPDGYVCYDPPADAPPVGPLPARSAGHVTFGCFNRLAKINPQIVAVWAAILRRLPSARLLLKTYGLEGKSTQERFLTAFAHHGIPPQQLLLEGASPHVELLDAYNRVDVALDPFPYGGGLVTCEALWMGVPVVTCPGETFASRHSLSHLNNIGMSELVAENFDHYVDLAVELACDLPRLETIRSGLRPRMAASPLCDGPRFARNFESLLRAAYESKAVSAASH